MPLPAQARRHGDQDARVGLARQEIGRRSIRPGSSCRGRLRRRARPGTRPARSPPPAAAGRRAPSLDEAGARRRGFEQARERSIQRRAPAPQVDRLESGTVVDRDGTIERPEQDAAPFVAQHQRGAARGSRRAERPCRAARPGRARARVRQSRAQVAAAALRRRGSRSKSRDRGSNFPSFRARRLCGADGGASRVPASRRKTLLVSCRGLSVFICVHLSLICGRSSVAGAQSPQLVHVRPVNRGARLPDDHTGVRPDAHAHRQLVAAARRTRHVANPSHPGHRSLLAHGVRDVLAEPRMARRSLLLRDVQDGRPAAGDAVCHGPDRLRLGILVAARQRIGPRARDLDRPGRDLVELLVAAAAARVLAAVHRRRR